METVNVGAVPGGQVLRWPGSSDLAVAGGREDPAPPCPRNHLPRAGHSAITVCQSLAKSPPRVVGSNFKAISQPRHH